jgi:hypothetical protein
MGRPIHLRGACSSRKEGLHLVRDHPAHIVPIVGTTVPVWPHFLCSADLSGETIVYTTGRDSGQGYMVSIYEGKLQIL